MISSKISKVNVTPRKLKTRWTMEAMKPVVLIGLDVLSNEIEKDLETELLIALDDLDSSLTISSDLNLTEINELSFNPSLEDWLANEVFFVDVVPETIVHHFEEWREPVESNIRHWLDTNTISTKISWLEYGRGFNGIPEKDETRFHELVMTLLPYK